MKLIRTALILTVAAVCFWLYATHAHAHHGWQSWCKHAPYDPICAKPWTA